MTKQCWKCKQSYIAKSNAEMAQNFYRDSTAKDGFNATCKVCFREFDRAKWARNYKDGTQFKERSLVRRQTRHKFGSAKKHPCLECGDTAYHWHHLKYEVTAAIALCKSCHMDAHE